jgi:hypothetical protein
MYDEWTLPLLIYMEIQVKTISLKEFRWRQEREGGGRRWSHCLVTNVFFLSGGTHGNINVDVQEVDRTNVDKKIDNKGGDDAKSSEQFPW